MGKKGQIPWNKGKKLGFIPKGAFKKGNIPWNTGTVGIKNSNSGSFKKGQNTKEENHNWKGGKRVSNGYVLIKCDGHPRADKRWGYVYEHILVIEKSINRFVTRAEKIHHINGIRDDNRLENLVLCKN